MYMINREAGETRLSLHVGELLAEADAGPRLEGRPQVGGRAGPALLFYVVGLW